MYERYIRIHIYTYLQSSKKRNLKLCRKYISTENVFNINFTVVSQKSLQQFYGAACKIKKVQHTSQYSRSFWYHTPMTLLKKEGTPHI